jgi:hypothetical protein
MKVQVHDNNDAKPNYAIAVLRESHKQYALQQHQHQTIQKMISCPIFWTNKVADSVSLVNN